MRFGNLRQSPLYLVLLIGSLLSIGTVSSAPLELDISFNHDLIYLDVPTGKLMILPVDQNKPEVLVGNLSNSLVKIDGLVVSYTASDTGHKFALVTKLPDETYEILWLDILTLETETVGEFPKLLDVKISPNGKWLAYREEDSEEIFAVEYSNPGEEVLIGTCQQLETSANFLRCRKFYWSPNSAQLVWSDARGLWISQPPVFAKKVLNNLVLKLDFKDSEDLIGQYSSPIWSPNSRYLILSRPVFIEGGDFVLLDISKGILVKIPRTFQSIGPQLYVSWLDATRLYVLHNDISFTRGPYVDAWQVDFSDSSGVKREGRYYIGFPCDFVYQTGLHNQRNVFYVLQSLPRDGCELQHDSGLYLAATSGSQLSFVVDFPAKSEPVNIVWSPDYQFAILYHEDYETNGSSYVDLLDLGQGIIEDLTPTIRAAELVCCFTWVK